MGFSFAGKQLNFFGYILTMWDVNNEICNNCLCRFCTLYINYVGCKFLLTRREALSRSWSYILTMWDVNITGWGKVLSGIMLYINYVGCKFIYFHLHFQSYMCYILTMWDVNKENITFSGFEDVVIY